MEEGLAELPESAGIRYGVALVAAAEGRADDARAALHAALEREPGVRAMRALDPELWALLDDAG
jgi:hypothetical protein